MAVQPFRGLVMTSNDQLHTGPAMFLPGGKHGRWPTDGRRGAYILHLIREPEPPGYNGFPLMAEERRIVTVLFADVVGSTTLAQELDPEDLRALLARFSCVRITSFRRLPTGSRRSSPRPLRRVRSSPRARASWNAKRGAEPARGEGKEEQYDDQQYNAEVSHLASLLFQDRRGLNDVSDRGGKEGKPLHRFPGNSRRRGNVVLFEVRHGRACGHRHGGVKRDWGGDGARVRRLGRPRRPDRPEGGAAGATRRGASRQPGCAGGSDQEPGHRPHRRRHRERVRSDRRAGEQRRPGPVRLAGAAAG